MSDKAFDRFWSVYPRRAGANPKAPARIKFLKLVAGGANPENIIEAARVYGKECASDVGTKFIAQAITWLNQGRFEDYTDSNSRSSIDEAEFARLKARYEAKLARSS